MSLKSFALGVASVAGASVRDWSGYTFHDYLAEFGKSYSGDEFAKREAVFAEKLAEVIAHNEGFHAGEHTWWATINEYSDWSEAEWKKIKTGKAMHNIHEHPVLRLAKTQANPDSMDWRDHGVVTPVKNQGGCGSCWAFSATEVFESHYAIATGSLLKFAPQAFVNCVQNPQQCGGSGGCEGATMELAFNLTTTMGMPLESDLPYAGRDQTCSSYTPAAKATGYVKIPENDADALETAIATKGPVSVTVAANWGGYGGGVYDGGCSSSNCALDHGVVAVGYSKDYWLVRNSWGSGWGESGYIRLSRKNDAVTYTDNRPADGVACKPYPDSQIVGGESGILFDTSYPTGVGAAQNDVVV
jgi:cathepsin L